MIFENPHISDYSPVYVKSFKPSNKFKINLKLKFENHGKK